MNDLPLHRVTFEFKYIYYGREDLYDYIKEPHYIRDHRENIEAWLKLNHGMVCEKYGNMIHRKRVLDKDKTIVEARVVIQQVEIETYDDFDELLNIEN